MALDTIWVKSDERLLYVLLLNVWLSKQYFDKRKKIDNKWFNLYFLNGKPENRFSEKTEIYIVQK